MGGSREEAGPARPGLPGVLGLRQGAAPARALEAIQTPLFRQVARLAGYGDLRLGLLLRMDGAVLSNLNCSCC